MQPSCTEDECPDSRSGNNAALMQPDYFPCYERVCSLGTRLMQETESQELIIRYTFSANPVCKQISKYQHVRLPYPQSKEKLSRWEAFCTALINCCYLCVYTVPAALYTLSTYLALQTYTHLPRSYHITTMHCTLWQC